MDIFCRYIQRVIEVILYTKGIYYIGKTSFQKHVKIGQEGLLSEDLLNFYSTIK